MSEAELDGLDKFRSADKGMFCSACALSINKHTKCGLLDKSHAGYVVGIICKTHRLAKKPMLQRKKN